MINYRKYLKRTVSALALGAAVATPFLDTTRARAQDIVIPSGATVGGQTLTNDQFILIQPGGRITDPATAITGIATIGGVDNSGIVNGGTLGISAPVINTVTNSGTIFGGAAGISAGAIGTVTNSGTISSSSVGVSAGTIGTVMNSGTINSATTAISAGTIGTLTNSGAISSSSVGVSAGTIGTVMNSGTISSGTTAISAATIGALTNSGTITGSGVFGVSAASIGTLTNSGTITGGVMGVSAATIGTLTNSGTITGDSFGVSVATIGTLHNTGTIRGGSIGVAAGTIDTLINGGAIIAPLGGATLAISVGGPVHLVLLGGSTVAGQILIGAGSSLTVGNGLSIDHTFLGLAPGTIQTHGAPFVVQGARVVVADVTNLAAQDEILADLTGGLFVTVGNRLFFVNQLAESRSAGPGRLYASTESQAGAGPDRRWQFWLRGFGAQRQQDAIAPAAGWTQRTGGIVAGADRPFGGDLRAGLFLGGALGEVEADFGSQNTDWNGIFGGAYVSIPRWGFVFDAALALGGMDYDRTRRVANNRLAGGVEFASADYQGFFVSPEVTVSRPMMVDVLPLVPSLTLRYAGLFLDGFTETGTSDGFSVGSRNIHLFTARGRLAMPMTHRWDGGAATQLTVAVGGEVRTRFGDDDVSGTLLGQQITFDPEGESTVGSVFFNVNLAHSFTNGLTLFANSEFKLEGAGSHQIYGELGLRYSF